MKILNLATFTLALVAATGAVDTSYANGTLGEALNPPAPILAPLPEDGGPQLVAYGCEGTAGPLWARDESDFPANCKEIIGETR